MNNSPRRTAAALTEVELLATENQRRVTVDDHAAWQASFHGPARMRSTGEVSRLIDLLDELDGKDGSK